MPIRTLKTITVVITALFSISTLAQTKGYNFRTTFERTARNYGVIEEKFIESDKSGILIRVVNDSDQELEGAAVTINDYDTSYTRVTAKNGVAQFFVKYGYYNLKVEHPGFETSTGYASIECFTKSFSLVRLRSKKPVIMEIFSNYELTAEDIERIKKFDDILKGPGKVQRSQFGKLRYYWRVLDSKNIPAKSN